MEKIFPSRKRCKTCGKGLKDTVIKGLYDSYSCAGMPVPSKNVADAPRQCKRQNDSGWGWKTRYRCVEEVPKHLKESPTVNLYECTYCGYLHIGHNNSTHTVEKARGVVRDHENLVIIVQKLLKQSPIPKREIAKRISVPMIRITEIERGDKKIDIDVLFRLLYHFHIRVEVFQV